MSKCSMASRWWHEQILIIWINLCCSFSRTLVLWQDCNLWFFFYLLFWGLEEFVREFYLFSSILYSYLNLYIMNAGGEMWRSGLLRNPLYIKWLNSYSHPPSFYLMKTVFHWIWKRQKCWKAGSSKKKGFSFLILL